MPKRLSDKDRQVLIDAVITRDGDICTLCRETPVKHRTLDHVNNKARDHRLENLALLCRSCNTSEGNRARRGQRVLTPENLSCWRARAHETLANAVGRNALAGAPGARVPLRVSERERTDADRRGWGLAEEAANLIMEPNYRLWLYRYVLTHGHITKEAAIDGGAEYLDQVVGRASQQTVERYFRKAISITGWLEERRSGDGQPVWCFRTDTKHEELRTLLERRMRTITPLVAAEPAEVALS